MITPSEAIEKLKRGHEKYQAGEPLPAPSRELLKDLYEHGQHPFAIVVTCSDSRVVPELIFHAQVGDLFVIRTAGQVISDIELGSIHYAVDHLGTRFIIVLGHTHCGAVQGACSSHHDCSPSLATLLSHVEPAVTSAKAECLDEKKFMSLAEDLNIMTAMETIANDDILRPMEDLYIVGAKYDIESGKILYWKRTARLIFKE